MSNPNKIQKKEILLEDIYKLDFKYKKEYHYCSQCTVTAPRRFFR